MNPIRIFLILSQCALLLCWASPSQCEPAAYIGAKKCAVCHKSERAGRQYAIWAESGHARAYETLGTPRAKELAKSLGIDDPQNSGQCLKCHSTAYAFTESRVSDTIAVEEGVSCETCHGAGSLYFKTSIMKDRQAAQAAGLEMPDAKTCAKCHSAGGPAAEDFDFEHSWEKIKHPKSD